MKLLSLILLVGGPADDVLKELREQQIRRSQWEGLAWAFFALAVMFLGFRIYRTCGKVNRYVKFRMSQRQTPPAPQHRQSSSSSPFDQMQP